MRLRQYTKRDLQIMAINLPPVVVLINILLFGERFFREIRVFLLSGLIVFVVMLITWFCFTWIAVTVRNRLPSDKDLIKRFAITIALIATGQALVITLFFRGYNYFHLFGYELNEVRYYWTLGIGFFLNVIITLVHEGFDSFEKWKATLTETEQLRKTYAQSQLLSLKSQVNPHFLFNSLNSLSSLINENEEKAEIFLNELTKVYRYLLRGSDEQLVPLETELQFIKSYYYLLKIRYGEGIQLDIEINEFYRNKYVAPLLLQTLFEYSFNSNTLSKESPLKFTINIDERGWLKVENNLQRKQKAAAFTTAGVDNLLEKYKLIAGERIEILNDDINYTVRIPLLNEHTIRVA